MNYLGEVNMEGAAAISYRELLSVVYMQMYKDGRTVTLKMQPTFRYLQHLH
jgi:hypothetical protein